MTAYMLIKFDKATGDGDLIRNIDALIGLVKEHLSFCILAIESRSSVSDHERTDFKSEYENVISNLLSTITSKMAKSGLSKYNCFSPIMFLIYELFPTAQNSKVCYYFLL